MFAIAVVIWEVMRLLSTKKRKEKQNSKRQVGVVEVLFESGSSSRVVIGTDFHGRRQTIVMLPFRLVISPTAMERCGVEFVVDTTASGQGWNDRRRCCFMVDNAKKGTAEWPSSCAKEGPLRCAGTAFPSTCNGQ